MIKREDSVIYGVGVENEMMRYVDERGRVLAEGDEVLAVVEDYLERLGYNLEDIDEYEWRDVVGNADYEVSELGLIREKETGLYINYNLKVGYEEGLKEAWRMKTWNLGLEVKRPYVAGVVAEAFIGERPEGYMVGHNNDIPIDNRASNLGYVTRGENVSTWRVLDEVRAGEVTVSRVNALRHYIGLYIGDIGDGYKMVEWQVEDVRNSVGDVSLSLIKAVYDLKYNQSGILSRLEVKDWVYSDEYK